MLAEHVMDGSLSHAQTLRDNCVVETLGAQFQRLFHIEFVSAVHGVCSPYVFCKLLKILVRVDSPQSVSQ